MVLYVDIECAITCVWLVQLCVYGLVYADMQHVIVITDSNYHAPQLAYTQLLRTHLLNRKQ